MPTNTDLENRKRHGALAPMTHVPVDPKEIEVRSQKSVPKETGNARKYRLEPIPDTEDPEASLYPIDSQQRLRAHQWIRQLRLARAEEEARRTIPVTGHADLRDLLWGAFAGRWWAWESLALGRMGDDVRATVQGLRKDLDSAREAIEQGPVAVADKQVPIQLADVLHLNVGDVAELTKDLALELPVVKQILGLASLVFKGGMTAKTYFAKVKANEYATMFVRTELTALGARSLSRVLSEKLEKQSVMLGCSALDQLAGFVDPTAIASLAVGVAMSVFKLLYKLRILARTRVQVKHINAVLQGNDPARFNLELFVQMPLLGCYVFEGTDARLSDYLGYTTPYDKNPREIKLGGVTNIVARDFTHIANLAAFESLKKMARSRRLAAPVILMERDGSVPKDMGRRDRLIAKIF